MTKVDTLIGYANLELGKPYVYADEGPNSFDCSGLMQFIFGKVGLQLPRTAASQQDYAKRVAKPSPGDLVFWGDPAYHVALYIGGGKVIEAPKPGGRVQISNLWGTPAGYGRVEGLGAGAAPYVGAATGALSNAGGFVGRLLGGARNIVMELSVAGLGLALVGYGLYRAARPKQPAGGSQ